MAMSPEVVPLFYIYQNSLVRKMYLKHYFNKINIVINIINSNIVINNLVVL